MDTKELFKGIAVIIDDQINDESSSIYNIKTILNDENIPVLEYDAIPDKAIIDSIKSASFIILDWDYQGSDMPEVGDGERIHLATSLKEENKNILFSFIKLILTETVVPVFLFSQENIESIRDELLEQGILRVDIPNRIFVKAKSEIDNSQHLFQSIEEWLKEMPSTYVLKEWENTVFKVKNDMFLELFENSTNWAMIIWNMLKKDGSKDFENQFGAYISRNLFNRVSSYSFQEDNIQLEGTYTHEELQRVVEVERYMEYNAPQPSSASVGDLFYMQDSEEYLLNIRAQCDLARTRNPELYCLKGKLLEDSDITSENIRLLSNKKIRFSNDTEYSLSQLRTICSDAAMLQDFNEEFDKHNNKVFFTHGELIEKNSHVIIACIDGGKTIKFNLRKFEVKKFNSIKQYRIGKILTPYITRVQQKCANYIVREGVPPIPEQLFSGL